MTKIDKNYDERKGGWERARVRFRSRGAVGDRYGESKQMKEEKKRDMSN